MAPCTYEQVERFITKEKKLFAAVKKQLRDKYQCNFRGVVPNDAHPYDRYVTAFNKHPQAFNEAIGMSMEKAFSLTHSKNKDKVGCKRKPVSDNDDDSKDKSEDNEDNEDSEDSEDSEDNEFERRYSYLKDYMMKQIAAKDQQIVARDQQIAAIDQQIVAKDQQIAAIEQQIVAKDQQIAAKEQQILQLRQKILQLHQSVAGQLQSM